MRGREPIGEIEDHAGEEARFGKSEQKTQDEKADRPADEGKRARNQAQVTIMRAIQRRAPTRSRIKLLGTSGMK